MAKSFDHLCPSSHFFPELAFGTQASPVIMVNKYSIQCIRPRPLNHLPLEMYPEPREAHGCAFLLFYFHTLFFVSLSMWRCLSASMAIFAILREWRWCSFCRSPEHTILQVLKAQGPKVQPVHSVLPLRMSGNDGLNLLPVALQKSQISIDLNSMMLNTFLMGMSIDFESSLCRH